MAGTAGAVHRRAASVGRMVLDRVAATPDREAFRYPVAGPGGGEMWRSLTWAELGDRVQAIAAGLLALGLRPEDRVAIASATRLAWVLADLAIMCAGGATTVYPSTQADDVAYILADAGRPKGVRLDLTVEAGELTPSLKVRRRVVEARHRDLLDEMYPAPVRS